MEFKGQYLSYDEYKALGGTLTEVPFNLLEYDVRKKIDEKTFGRLVNLKDIPSEVKMCVFKMVGVEERYKPLESQNMAVKSEEIDGYSISYGKLEKADIEAKEQELENIIKSYLANLLIDGVPALYIGADK